MFVKNFLRAGDFLTVVPSGIPITLQYNVKGYIECVYVRWGDAKIVDENKRILNKLIENKLVPTHISVKGGTTFVFGTLYTGSRLEGEGELPRCVEECGLLKFYDDPTSFNFFAGSVESHGTVFRGAASTRNWLKMAGFHVLPGFVIPANLTEQLFESMVNTDLFSFRYPMISDYIVYSGSQIHYYNLGVRQIHINQVMDFVDNDGKILGTVFSQHLDSALLYDWSDVVTYNLRKGRYMVIDELNNILDVFGDAKSTWDKTRICAYCGRTIVVPSEGVVRCSDEQCNSRLMERTNRFLRILGLPEITRERYEIMIKSFGKLYSIPDVLGWDMYQKYDIPCTLSTVLRSIVPADVLKGKDNFDFICTKCNNSVEALEYYLTYPDNLLSDFHLMDRKEFYGLVNWLHSEENLADVIALLHHPHIHIQMFDKRFDGPPIFRGKTIYITGVFKHGSVPDIKAILHSYSAEVVTTFDDISNVDCVILGGFNESIDGKSVNLAKTNNVPIFTEDDFFDKYDIETDMAENL